MPYPDDFTGFPELYLPSTDFSSELELRKQDLDPEFDDIATRIAHIREILKAIVRDDWQLKDHLVTLRVLDKTLVAYLAGIGRYLSKNPAVTGAAVDTVLPDAIDHIGFFGVIDPEGGQDVYWSDGANWYYLFKLNPDGSSSIMSTTGAIMTGPLDVSEGQTEPGHAASRGYVDDGLNALATAIAQQIEELKLTDLADAPETYAGSEGLLISVKPDGTGIEFRAISIDDLGNVFPDMTGGAGKILVVNQTEDGFTLEDMPVGGGGAGAAGRNSPSAFQDYSYIVYPSGALPFAADAGDTDQRKFDVELASKLPTPLRGMNKSGDIQVVGMLGSTNGNGYSNGHVTDHVKFIFAQVGANFLNLVQYNHANLLPSAQPVLDSNNEYQYGGRSFEYEFAIGAKILLNSTPSTPAEWATAMGASSFSPIKYEPGASQNQLIQVRAKADGSALSIFGRDLDNLLQVGDMEEEGFITTANGYSVHDVCVAILESYENPVLIRMTLTAWDQPAGGNREHIVEIFKVRSFGIVNNNPTWVNTTDSNLELMATCTINSGVPIASTLPPICMQFDFENGVGMEFVPITASERLY